MPSSHSTMGASTPRPRQTADGLRTGAWLTVARARAYGWIFLAVSLAIAFAWIALSRDGLDPTGKPLGADFTSFWAASKLALAGHPAAAYDVRLYRVQQIALFGRDLGYAALFYPPIFLAVCLPLALLPYFAALALWLGATGAAYWRVVRAWLGRRLGVMPIFAFPAVLVNIGNGQNGFLSAALFGAGALWLESRPILAGLCLGSLAYKPHLGLLIPIALALAGRWKTLVGAAAVVVAWMAASVALFGLDTWKAFLSDSALARATLEQGLVGDAKMQSAFAAARLWGGGVAIAYGAQVAAAALAVVGLVWLHRRAPKSEAEGPALIVAALLASPYLLDYDLVILAIPMSWMLRQGALRGFLDWEKTVLAATFVLPAISRMLAAQMKLPLAPFLMGALLWLVIRRGVGARDEGRAAI